MAGSDLDRSKSILDGICEEFLIDARERIEAVEAALGSHGGVDTEALTVIRREVHNLKGMGTSFGFPVVSMIAHRLEDYIADLSALDERQVGEVTAFVDRLQDIVDAGTEPDDEAARALIRALPAFPTALSAAEAPRDVEVLLVCPSRAVAHIVLRTLRSLGFRVITARSPWQALELAVRTRPDLVITSVVMPGISGIDLACAFSSVAATRDLPVALLTSFESDHPELQRVTADTAVIRLDKSLESDLAEAITRFSLV